MCSGGFFFAVKEVSLLGQGEEDRQRILQLQQVSMHSITAISCNNYLIPIILLFLRFCIHLFLFCVQMLDRKYRTNRNKGEEKMENKFVFE